MKITKQHLANLAEDWSDAYRADYNGREVSIEIIRAMLNWGMTEDQSEWVYYSKHLRWFFDFNDDKVDKAHSFEKFTEYLSKNRNNVLEDIKTCVN
jgi:hypothetical protein